MLADLHAGLRALMYKAGQIDPDTVDVAFETPVRAWVSSLTRPTLDFFLYDLEENTERRETAVQTTKGNGRGVHRLPPRRVDLRYMVSALTADIGDEHLLLWRTLVTLMKNPTIPAELLPPDTRALELPVLAAVAKPKDSDRALDIWSGLDTPPRPALFYTITLPLDLEIEITAPLVLTRTARYATSRDGRMVADQRTHFGGLVVDRQGQPVAGARIWIAGHARDPVISNAAGEYTLSDIPDATTLRLQIAHGTSPPTTAELAVASTDHTVVIDQ
jgi:hypothetical protein